MLDTPRTASILIEIGARAHTGVHGAHIHTGLRCRRARKSLGGSKPPGGNENVQQNEQSRRHFAHYDELNARGLLQIAQAVRHIGENESHDCHAGHALAEVLRIDFVEGIGFGVMPIKVVRA